jgi:galactokinase
MSPLLARVSSGFAVAFGGAPALVARAPGRVNLIGEHTDYNDGFVLPAAIGKQTLVAARPRADRRLRVVAVDFAGAETSFSLDAPIAHDPAQGWSDHARGMVSAMRAAGLHVPGADLAVAGDIPRGSGLSSSASLAVAIGTALSELADLGVDGTSLAQMAQQSECDFVGVKCGIMDQLISARGVAGHALLIDCRSLACVPVPVPEAMAIMIVHSGVERGLVDGHYNTRRAQCESAARALGVSALRDADLPLLAAHRLDPLVHARARHVITENARTLAAAEALRSGDLAALGELMRASHASMRDDFAITVPAIDALAKELSTLIGPQGGARMTGGGFGGAVVAVMPRERAPAVAAALRYRTPSGEAPLVLIEHASAGAALV